MASSSSTTSAHVWIVVDRATVGLTTRSVPPPPPVLPAFVDGGRAARALLGISVFAPVHTGENYGQTSSLVARGGRSVPLSWMAGTGTGWRAPDSESVMLWTSKRNTLSNTPRQHASPSRQAAVVPIVPCGRRLGPTAAAAATAASEPAADGGAQSRRHRRTGDGVPRPPRRRSRQSVKPTCPSCLVPSSSPRVQPHLERGDAQGQRVEQSSEHVARLADPFQEPPG